ncbi:MAG TPA: DUF402 domain-containing protein [Pseudonocardiaceae bacterium]|nr:DUF402 domain-containing protein [Pseudonocardiaceae bacterium]
MTDGSFAPGSTAVRRDVLRGKVWTATPNRVLADSAGVVVLTCWPGVGMLSPTTWIHWLRTGDDAVRKQAIPNLAAGTWELGDWTWRDTTLVSRFASGDHFSVHRFLSGGPAEWYVNFERPYRRTPIGIDTFDLLVDLVVSPDLSSHRWKDEDEYAQGRRLGLIDDATHAHVDHARERVLGLLAAAEGPFAEDWSGFRPEPHWPLPVLPPDSLTAT